MPTLLLMSGSGMAAGTWLAGVLYDYFGYYAPAFAAGVAFNLRNIVVITTLVLRQRYSAPPGLTAALLRLDAGLLDDRPPLVDLGLVPGSERLRRLLFARRHFEAEIVEPLAAPPGRPSLPPPPR